MSGANRYFGTSGATRYFGTPEQQALERRADLLWRIVGDDPRYSCHGRAVALTGQSAEDADRQIAPAQLQGVGPSPRLTPEVTRARAAEIERAGLVTDIYAHWQADLSAVAIAREMLSRDALPAGLGVHEVGAGTPDQDHDSLDDLTRSCGVLLPGAAFLRGDIRPAVCLFARMPGGAVLGVAAAVARNSPASPEADRVWWGMLSTAGDRRGRGIARLLGVMVLVAMADRYGAQRFDTGIRAGNVGSARLCAGLGVSASGLPDLMAIDPVTMSGGRMTG